MTLLYVIDLDGIFDSMWENFFLSNGRKWARLWFRSYEKIKIKKPTYISYINDTHQILFGSANSVESYCVHVKSPRTYVQPDRQPDIFFCLFCLLRRTNHEHSSKGENFFFHSCSYNTFSFYIIGMWWESKKKFRKTKKKSTILKQLERVSLNSIMF